MKFVSMGLDIMQLDALYDDVFYVGKTVETHVINVN